jgi:hypothetical protein
MFNLFGRKTAKDFMEEAKETYGVPKQQKFHNSMSGANEFYRVGCTDAGETTLTLMGFDGSNMTLTMNQEACEKLIRMLQSTFQEEQITEETE